MFSKLDDYDVLGAIKEWTNCDDEILKDLAQRINDRRLFKIKLQNEEISNEEIDNLRKNLKSNLKVSVDSSDYYIISGKVENNAYRKDHENIYLLRKDGSVQDIAFSTDQQSVSAISEAMKKYYVIYPREIE
jgi:RNA-binding protein YhbY